MSRRRRLALLGVLSAAWILVLAVPALADDCARLFRARGVRGINDPYVLQDCMRTGGMIGVMIGGGMGLVGAGVALGGLPGGATSDILLGEQSKWCNMLNESAALERQLTEEAEKIESTFSEVSSTYVGAKGLIHQTRESWLRAKMTRAWGSDAAIASAFMGGYFALMGKMLGGAAAAFADRLAVYLGMEGGTLALGGLSGMPNIDTALAMLDAQDAKVDQWREEQLEGLKNRRAHNKELMDRTVKDTKFALDKLKAVEADLTRRNLPFTPCATRW